MNKRYHLTGVAGTGMSALAQILAASGCQVSGSDRLFDTASHACVRNRSALETLQATGITMTAQDGSGVAPGTDAVIVSSAIESDNPDIQTAKRTGIPIRHRADVLAELTRGHTLVAIAGSSGKSTVTGMTGWILEGADFDPVVVNGAELIQWSRQGQLGNTRWGAGSTWVVEVDESDRSLLKFNPDWAVITNVSKDHFDVEATARLFRDFEARVKTGVIRGRGERGILTGWEPRINGQGSEFDFRGAPVRLRLPGRHNAENAYVAAVLSEKLGAALDTIRERLGEFQGIRRRFEIVSRAQGVTVVDDYAHNPAKISAAWTAARLTGTRVLGIWRPHGYGPLAAMMEELAETFGTLCRDGDRLSVLPVYDAGGTANRSVSANDLVERVQRLGANAEAAPDVPECMRQIGDEAKAGDVILVMGARDPGLPWLARDIAACIEKRADLRP